MKKIKDFFKKHRSSSLFFSIPVAFIILLIIVVELYFVIPFYKSTKEKKGITELYFATNISNAHRKIIDKFNELNEGRIKVIPVDLPFKTFNTNERKELLARSLRNRSDRMDIFEVDLIWVKRFAKWCLPMDRYFSKEEISEFLPSAIKSCYYDTNLVAIPHYSDIGIMYYRDDLLKELPDYTAIKNKLERSMTWSEFISLSKKFNIEKNPFYIFPAEDYEGLVCSYLELILSQNRNFFDQEKIDLTQPESKRALETLVGFVRSGSISPSEVLDFNENSGYEYFLKNDGVFFRGWPNFDRDNKNLYQDPKKTKYLVKTALPHYKGNEPGFIIGGWNLMVSKYTSKKEEIIEFLKFMVSEEAQSLLYREGGYLPTLRKFYEEPAFSKKYPELERIKLLSKYAVHRPLLEDYTRISDIISHYVHKAIKGDIGADRALSEATELINSNKIPLK